MRGQAGQGLCLGHGDSALAASPGAEGPERAGQAVPLAARPSALNQASACHSRVPMGDATATRPSPPRLGLMPFAGDATASALKPRRPGHRLGTEAKTARPSPAASPVLGHDGEAVRRDLDEALEGRVASRHRAVEPLRRQGGVGWGWGELSQGDVGGGREKVGGGVRVEAGERRLSESGAAPPPIIDLPGPRSSRLQQRRRPSPAGWALLRPSPAGWALLCAGPTANMSRGMKDKRPKHANHPLPPPVAIVLHHPRYGHFTHPRYGHNPLFTQRGARQLLRNER